MRFVMAGLVNALALLDGAPGISEVARYENFAPSPALIRVLVAGTALALLMSLSMTVFFAARRDKRWREYALYALLTAGFTVAAYAVLHLPETTNCFGPVVEF
jgi:hypothetical protein